MNYIEEMNAFNVWITLHPEVSSSAQVLWYVLMYYNNTCSWKKHFSVPMSMLMISTRLTESSVKRARIALQKAGRIRYTVCPGKKATVYEMISMKGEGIVTSFLSGNSAAITTDMSDSEDIVREEIVSEEVGSEEVVNADEGNDTEEDIDEEILLMRVENDLPHGQTQECQSEQQGNVDNAGQSIPKNEGQSDCLGERLPERLPERLAERLPERILKLNKTKLNISKESTKKGSEAILVEPQDNTLKNAEEDMSQPISKSKSKSTSKFIAKSTSKSVPKSRSKSALKPALKSNIDDQESPFVPSTLAMVQAYCRETGYHINPEAFMAYYIDPEMFMAYCDAVGWSVGKKMMKSWKPCGRRWFITSDEAG